MINSSPMTTALHKTDDGTIEITVTIPWTMVKDQFETVMTEAVAAAELPGFRKGKAPRAMVEERLDKSKMYEETIRQLIPKIYNDAITKEKIKPILQPKIVFKEALEEKDWVVQIITSEKPEVTLGDYKKAIADLNASKRNKIWTPGQKAEETKKEEKNPKPTIDELLAALYGAVKATLPAILVEHEVNRLLSDLLDQTKKLGLTVEQYLGSTGRTSDSVRKEYEEQAKRVLTLEFALEQIADENKILVEDDDIDAILKSSKSDEERKALEGQRYYLASVLRRQKTIDMLAGL